MQLKSRLSTEQSVISVVVLLYYRYSTVDDYFSISSFYSHI